MNTSSQGQEAQAYLQRIKKQAKRLLKFAKEHNNTIEIHNLAQAQELLAKMNGYPDWHSLEKNLDKPQIDIDSEQVITQVENMEKIAQEKSYIVFNQSERFSPSNRGYSNNEKSYSYYKDNENSCYWSAFEITDFSHIPEDYGLINFLHFLMNQEKIKSGKNIAGITSVIIEYAPDDKQTYTDINPLIKELIGNKYLEYRFPLFKMTFVFQSCFKNSQKEEAIMLEEHFKHLDNISHNFINLHHFFEIKWKTGFNQKQWEIINQRKEEYQIKTVPETRQNYIKHHILQKLLPFISWKEPQATMSLSRWIAVVRNLIFNNDKNNNWTINLTSEGYQIYGDTDLDAQAYAKKSNDMMSSIEQALYENKMNENTTENWELEAKSKVSLQLLLDWLKSESPLPAKEHNGALLFTPSHHPMFYHSQTYNRTTHINVIQSKKEKILTQFGSYLQLGEIFAHYDKAMKKTEVTHEALPYQIRVGGEEIKNFEFILKSSIDKKYHKYIQLNEMKENLRWNIFHLPLGATHPSPVNEDHQKYFLEKIVHEYIENNKLIESLPRSLHTEILASHINKMYRSNQSQPKMYQENKLIEIDDYFRSHGHQKMPDISLMSWWDVTQYLIEWDEYELAYQSQLMAEPNLNDYIEILNSHYDINYQALNENPLPVFVKALKDFIKNNPGFSGEGWDNPDLLDKKINLFYISEKMDSKMLGFYESLVYLDVNNQWCNYWTESDFLSQKIYERIKTLQSWHNYKHIFLNNIDTAIEDGLLISLCREARKCNIGVTMGTQTSVHYYISSFVTANWIFNSEFLLPEYEYIKENQSWKSWCSENQSWRCVLILMLNEGKYYRKLGLPPKTKMEWLMNPDYTSVHEKLIKHHTLPEVLNLMDKHAIKVTTETIEFKDIPTQWDDYINQYPL
jgi:hypothetical protein